MKKSHKTIIKIAVTALILFLLYRRMDWAGFAAMLRGIRLWPLAGFFAICVVNMWLSSFRWWMLMRADGIDIPVHKLFASHWIASFFNFFMPSNIGGDVYRIADITKKSGKAPNTVAAVFADRLTGFIAMSLLGFVFPLMGLRMVPEGSRKVLLVPLAVFLCFIVLAALVLQQGLLRFMLRLVFRGRHGKVVAFLDKFFESVRAYGRRPGVLVRCLLVSLLFQFLVAVAVFCLGTALGLEIPFFGYCIFVPLVSLLESVPSTINGMGFRDAGYMMFFTAAGIASPAESAAAMALLYMMLTLIYASFGGLLFLRRLQRA